MGEAPVCMNFFRYDRKQRGKLLSHQRKYFAIFIRKGSKKLRFRGVVEQFKLAFDFAQPPAIFNPVASNTKYQRRNYDYYKDRRD